MIIGRLIAAMNGIWLMRQGAEESWASLFFLKKKKKICPR
jgi:hypothetical protein